MAQARDGPSCNSSAGNRRLLHDLSPRLDQINRICTLRSGDAGGRELRQIGGYLRTQHGPAPITERAPVMVPVWRRIESARLISWARCWLPRPEHLVLGVCARGAPTRPAGAGRRTGAWKLGGAGGPAHEKVAAWRPTGRDRRRTRASGRC